MSRYDDEYLSWDPEFRRAISDEAERDYAAAHAMRVARMNAADRADKLCALLESIPQMHEDEAARQFKLGDPGAANAHRAWAKRIREHIASAMSAGTAETQSGSGLQPASAAPAGGDAQ